MRSGRPDTAHQPVDASFLVALQTDSFRLLGEARDVNRGARGWSWGMSRRARDISRRAIRAAIHPPSGIERSAPRIDGAVNDLVEGADSLNLGTAWRTRSSALLVAGADAIQLAAGELGNAASGVA